MNCEALYFDEQWDLKLLNDTGIRLNTNTHGTGYGQIIHSDVLCVQSMQQAGSSGLCISRAPMTRLLPTVSSRQQGFIL